jgi:hypothetical protein
MLPPSAAKPPAAHSRFLILDVADAAVQRWDGTMSGLTVRARFDHPVIDRDFFEAIGWRAK